MASKLRAGDNVMRDRPKSETQGKVVKNGTGEKSDAALSYKQRTHPPIANRRQPGCWF
ncbi:protein of unknown function [Methylocella tundrae]|jgi:hypothetical protein|uniref:Uncharacterized protein n=1 Tax=Methylocella tundrae TaxID=227605 RepID=A0A4U8YYI8_METTU|nr:protein of unknown function [Methylocella tundrae]